MSYPGLDHLPFEPVEGPLEPPVYPTIPEGESGFYDYQNDEFVSDDYALEYIGEMWDREPDKKIAELEEFLVDWYFRDWERIEA